MPAKYLIRKGFQPVFSANSKTCSLIAMTVIAGMFTSGILMLAGCAAGPGMHHDGPLIHSQYAPEKIPYRVITPPDWNGVTPLPLVILLHDRRGNMEAFDKSGVLSALDRMIRDQVIPGVLLVIPESKSGFWWNFYDGSHRYADVIVRELIPAVRAEYPIRTETRYLHLFGIGTGAMGAVEIAYLYPGIFGSVGLLNGRYFDAFEAAAYVEQNPFSGLKSAFGPSDNPRAMAARSVYDHIRSAADVGNTRFVIGNSTLGDWKLNESNELFQEHLFQLGIPHDKVIFHESRQKHAVESMIPVLISLQLGIGDVYGDIGGNPYHVLRFN